ncbi:MAG TPA: hypothetical protein VKB75_17165 [Jatrophihabitans sp.]|nr:hypothetical protein [Jatrophihabitans sp.]
MGYQTIQAHRKELNEKIKVFEALVASAKSVTGQMAKIAEAQKKVEAEAEKIYTVLQKMATEMEKLDTKGVKEFEEFRQSLVALGSGNSRSMRPLPTKSIEVAVSRMRGEVEKEQRAWIEKLAANMPAELKPGMVLIDKTIGNEYEIKSGPQTSKNPNLSGDAAIFYDVICYRNGSKSEFPMTKADLKKNGMKFVRS